jgi:hypothetical protein
MFIGRGGVNYYGEILKTTVFNELHKPLVGAHGLRVSSDAVFVSLASAFWALRTSDP